jgi:mxaJ protein
MFLRCPKLIRRLPRIGPALVVALVLSTALAAAESPRVLRVAADPNNLPFSNDRGEGFENKLVELLAGDLGATVDYTWRAQRRGFFRETLKEGRVDLVAGVPRGFELGLTTHPYYRSTYVLVQRAGCAPSVNSIDDPALKTLRIGVQLIGDDSANTPPAHALSQRGYVDNIRGYTVYGDYRQSNPPARIIDAVLQGDVDAAFVWGPLAGYFAQPHGDELRLVPLPASDPVSGQRFAFDICLGVRKGDRALRDELNAILARRKPEIDALLERYGVPRAEGSP